MAAQPVKHVHPLAAPRPEWLTRRPPITVRAALLSFFGFMVVCDTIALVPACRDGSDQPKASPPSVPTGATSATGKAPEPSPTGSTGQPKAPVPQFQKVRIHGQTFNLELALDSPTRIKGLSNRPSIPEDGGMLFAFPSANNLNFVMRDCPNQIDIIFLDAAGRVTATHRMLPEKPQQPGESIEAYEGRLKKYPSRFAAQFAIELKGGWLDKLNIKDGEKIEIDADALKKRAK